MLVIMRVFVRFSMYAASPIFDRLTTSTTAAAKAKTAKATSKSSSAPNSAAKKV